MHTHARTVSLLGVVITVLLLLGVSCSSGTSTDLGKSVVSTGPYTIAGNIWYDVNNNGNHDYNDLGAAFVPVYFYDNYYTPPQVTIVYTDFVGTYMMYPIPYGHYGRVRPININYTLYDPPYTDYGPIYDPIMGEDYRAYNP
jgi:hypothetical protein